MYICRLVKKVLKKTIPVIFSFLIVFNTGGYFLLYKTLQFQINHEIRKQIKSNLPEKDLVQIQLPLYGKDAETSSFKWIQHFNTPDACQIW